MEHLVHEAGMFNGCCSIEASVLGASVRPPFNVWYSNNGLTITIADIAQGKWNFPFESVN